MASNNTQTKNSQQNKYWEFLDKFKFDKYNITEYRRALIDRLQKYSPDEFYENELMVEKMFWDLKGKTAYLFDTDSSYNKYSTIDEALEKFYEDNSYRSAINKQILITDDDIYYKPFEGSSPILVQNEFNNYLWCAMQNPEIYNKVMNDPKSILILETPKYYFQQDYGFPNLNTIKPFAYNETRRRERIRRMYYDQNAEKNWFKLIR